MHQKKTILFLIALSTSFSMLAGGGWVKDKNTGYYKLSQAWVETDGYFSGSNNFSPGLQSSLLTTSFYMEHGLGGGVSFETYLPFFVNHSTEGIVIEDSVEFVAEDAISGIGDLDVGLRFKLYQSDLLNVSGTARLSLPLGSIGKGERGNLFTGDGEFNQLLRVDASVPFGNKKVGGYANAYAGFNNRSEPFTNEFHYGFEAGISAAQSRLWVIGRLLGIDAGNESETEFTNGFTQSMSFTNYMVEAVFYMDESIGLSVSYTGSVSGNVLLVAPVYSAGLFMDIR